MKSSSFLALSLLLVGGCASSPENPVSSSPLTAANGPNWEEVDRTAQRVKERERPKARFVETERKVEAGFLAMTDEEYSKAVESARSEVRKANPKMSETEVETEAVRRADEVKWRHEHSYTQRSSSTYELKRP